MGKPVKKSERYRTFAGDKLHTSFAHAVTTASDFQTALVATGLSAVANAAYEPANVAANTIFNAAYCAFAIAFTRWFENKLLTKTFGRAAIEGKAIDKKPDESAAVNSVSRYGLKGRGMRSVYLYYAAYVGAFVGMFAGIQTVMGGQSAIFAMNAMASASPLFTRMFTGANRFHKIVNGEWAITDMPHPEEVRETKKVKEHNGHAMPV